MNPRMGGREVLVVFVVLFVPFASIGIVVMFVLFLLLSTLVLFSFLFLFLLILAMVLVLVLVRVLIPVVVVVVAEVDFGLHVACCIAMRGHHWVWTEHGTPGHR